MNIEPNLICQKQVDWSLLQWGTAIPVSAWNLLHATNPEIMVHGASMKIKLIVEGDLLDAELVNQNFSREKFSDHRDLIQIRYLKPVARRMQQIFAKSYAFLEPLKKDKSNRRKKILIPEDLHESVRLCATNNPAVFALDCYPDTKYLEIKEALKDIPEEIYEVGNDDIFMNDATAHIEQRSALVKYRKMDQSIILRLKRFYDYRCQITGERIGDMFGNKTSDSVVEAHHIEYFTKSQNNDSTNIIVISPNYHRIIHKNNPEFNRKKMEFVFPNGEHLKLKLFDHLKK